jgi:hypothetical protein
MTTFTINTDDKNAEKVLKAFLDALKLNYEIKKTEVAEHRVRPFNKKEKQIYESLKGSLTDIKKWEKGELELKDAKAFLNEL